MRLRDDQVKNHVEGLVRDARRNLADLDRAVARARGEVEALEARASRGRDRIRLAQRLRVRLLDAVAGAADEA